MTILAGDIGTGPQCCWTHREKWAADQPEDTPGHWPRTVFIVCSTCGNKRCPKATDCSLECTHSNAPGQKGSVYE